MGKQRKNEKSSEINHLEEECGFDGQLESEYEYNDNEPLTQKHATSFPDNINGARRLTGQTVTTTEDQKRIDNQQL